MRAQQGLAPVLDYTHGRHPTGIHAPLSDQFQKIHGFWVRITSHRGVSRPLETFSSNTAYKAAEENDIQMNPLYYGSDAGGFLNR